MYRLIVLSLVCIMLVTGCALQEKASFRSDTSAHTGYYAMNNPGKNEVLQDALDVASAADMQEQEFRGSFSVMATELGSTRQGRLVVYTAVINVVVERIYDSIKTIENAVVGMGGYMQEMTNNSITLKVPAAKFQDAIAEAEKLGEVTKRDIKGSDVTEEMRDLNIRLQNAEQSRDKLIAIMENAQSVEDALKIEKELERITETIELLKGKISYLQNKVNFSTLTVVFNSPIPQVSAAFPIPFYWVQKLSSEITRPVRTNPTKKSFFGIFEQSNFKIPESYIKYYQHKDATRAMSAEGVVIYQYKEKNYKGGNLEFWSSLVRKELVEQKTIRITEQEEIKLNNKKDAILFVGTKQASSKQYGYLAAVVPTKDNVYVLEAWGPFDDFQADKSKLEKAIKSLKVH